MEDLQREEDEFGQRAAIGVEVEAKVEVHVSLASLQFVEADRRDLNTHLSPLQTMPPFSLFVQPGAEVELSTAYSGL